MKKVVVKAGDLDVHDRKEVGFNAIQSYSAETDNGCRISCDASMQAGTTKETSSKTREINDIMTKCCAAVVNLVKSERLPPNATAINVESIVVHLRPLDDGDSFASAKCDVQGCCMEPLLVHTLLLTACQDVLAILAILADKK